VDGSGISPEIIDEMGAWSATTKAQLQDLGFRQPEIRPPALVLPVFTWSDPDQPVYSRIRPEVPRLDPKGKPRKYEQPSGQACRIYCLPTARRLIEGLQGVAERPAAALPYLFLTEGEKKAAALVSKGLAALAIPGVWNFKNQDALRGDWDLIGLKGMPVCILFDSDAATNEHVRKAEERLAELLKAMQAKVYLCRLPSGPNDGKIGADDFFIGGGTVEDLAELIEEYQRPQPEAQSKPSLTEDLVRLGREQATFWNTNEKEPFATIRLPAGGFDNLPVKDTRFRTWFSGEVFRFRKLTAPREALDRAIDNLACHALYEGPTLETSIRIGHADGAVWLDLCDKTRQVVRIDATGWVLVPDDQCPIRFIRPKAAESLPVPLPGGTLNDLKELLCVDSDGFTAIRAYLLGAFMPHPGGFPLLVVTGEQGSGKSFGCTVLRELLDPTRLNLRRLPKAEDDLGASLNSGYLLAFDNLSSLPTWLSDSLCSLATGGGISQRQKYTDAEEHIVTGRRPVLLNGINDAVSAPDLAERSLFVEFQRPPDSARRAESDLVAAFTFARARVLGALLDHVARAVRDREKVRPPGNLPRLADFALWVYAGTPEPDRDEMWRVLGENRKAKNLATIESDDLSQAVRKLAEEGGFIGPARDLFALLNERHQITKPKDRPEGWPASPDALGKRLKRLATVFSSVGIVVEKTRTREGSSWRIVPRKEGEEVPQVPQVSPEACFEPETGPDGSGTWENAPTEVSQEVSPAVSLDLNLNPEGGDTCGTCDTLSLPLDQGPVRKRVLL